MSPGQSSRPVPAWGRTESTVWVLYLGLLLLLLIEQFVLRAPPRAYLDVALLFALTTIVLALTRARSRLRVQGKLVDAVVGVLPVALVGAAVGAVMVLKGGTEPPLTGLVAGGLVFLLAFVSATAGTQYVVDQRRRESSDRS